MKHLDDSVPIPPIQEINIGLSHANESTMLNKFGRPVDSTEDHSPLYKNFRDRIKGADLGPFRVYGLDYAIESLKLIFSEDRKELPDVYKDVKTAGVLSVRHIRKNPNSYSNHSWGTAIDIYFGDSVVPQGIAECHRGVLLLYPYFNKYGWYWGAGFSGEQVDSMHFELSEETIRSLPDSPPKRSFIMKNMFTLGFNRLQTYLKIV
jgi:hypothetical protein